jgi:flagellar biosynthetic protein FlhB
VLFWQALPALLALLDIHPAAYVRPGFGLANGLVLKLLIVLGLIALVDVLYTRRSYLNRLKMSRRELKEEIKNREGDPRIRARLRQLQRELVKRSRAIKRLPDADVLITNPTHLAVALLYRRETMAAPQVLAKGAGELAEYMKVLARRHRVPVIENRALARKLFYAVELEQGIPEALFPQVARVLVWAYAWRTNDGVARRAA